MIAVRKEQYRGLKTYRPSAEPLRLAKRLLEKLSEEEVELLDRLMTEGVQYVDSPVFHNRKSATELEASYETGEDEIPQAQARLMPFDMLDVAEQAVPRFKPLNLEQESRLFLKLNYAKCKIYRLLRRRGAKQLTLTTARLLVRWKKRELKIRSLLTQANIPLVLAMAKRTKPSGVDFADLISEGNMALLRSLDKYDCSRGFKFSTYACRAILKSFSRVAHKTSRYRDRFPVEFDPDLERGDLQGTRREDMESECVDEIRDLLGSEVSELSEVERSVLRARFAIGRSQEGEEEESRPMTLEEVGKIIGLTKERVRQIQNKALAKLKEALENTVLAG